MESTTTHLPYEGETRTAQVAPLSVRLLRLDDLVAGGEIRLPNFVKIDVEGHAHKALAGARKAIAAAQPIIVVAFHSDLEVAGVHAILDPLGYTCSPIATHSGSSVPTIGHDFIFHPAARVGVVS